MPEKKRMTSRLKDLFERPEIFILPGGMNPISAKVAEVVGFDAFYMSGGYTMFHTVGWPDPGSGSLKEMVDNARRIALAVDIPVFADMETGFGDAVVTYKTVQEYIRAGIAGGHIEDQTFPAKLGPRQRCISTEEMVGKLRAAMDAKMDLDPDFVIVARCDYAAVPGATFEDVIQRCLAYKEQAKVDVVCPHLESWDEIKEAIKRIPGPVLPLFTHGPDTHPTLEELQEAGAAAAWYPGLTGMPAQQGMWDMLNDFKERGAEALDEFLERSQKGKWGAADMFSIMGRDRLLEMEKRYLPPLD